MKFIDAFDFLFKGLEKRKIQYMLSGSYAFSLYGEVRGTRDIDVVVDLNDENIESFFSIFNEDYYFNKKEIAKDISSKRIFNIIHSKEGFKFDFIPLKDDAFAINEFSRKKYLQINGFHAWAVTAEDLVISKLKWIQDTASEMHQKDIKSILNKGEVDKAYIKHWTSKLNLQTFDLI